ncbi:MAG: helix-hairpin-helix domain-containing protein [Candidatus Eisenbacteria bacterium]|nr:helix-hairpin-helix domain-containing protein [Candidatus Eisenbacteria bacterium]
MKGFLTRDERSVVLFLAVAVAAGSFVLGVMRIDPSTVPPTESEAAGAADVSETPPVVDLNTASGPELESLPGIGPVKAKAILELRAERGRFRSVGELDDVRGIGPATLEALRPFVAVRDTSSGDRARGPDEEQGRSEHG